MLTKFKNNGNDEYYYDYYVLTKLATVGGEKKGMKRR